MTIANGRAEYEREVLRPTSTGRLGVTERGTGAVSPTGDVSLAGSAGGQTWRYEASYAGQLNGRTLRLTGNQLWHLPDKPDHSRPCTVTVSRTTS